MESSGVIEQQKLFGAGRDIHRQHRTSAMNATIAGIEELQQGIVRTVPVSVKSAFPVATEQPIGHDEAGLLKELDAIAWSWPQKLSFAVVFVCLIGFATYSYYDSEAWISMQAWTEGRDAGHLAAVDPIHNVPCPYQESLTGDAWHNGFREGYRIGRIEREARDAARKPN